MRILFKAFVLLLVFLLDPCPLTLAPISHAATQNFTKATKKHAKNAIPIEKPLPSLRVGEKFVYEVCWLGIPVGEGTLEVKEMAAVNGRQAYHVIAIARANEFLSSFYNVQDTIHSYIDAKDLCSLKFEKHVREGKYKTDEVVIFDQDKHRGYYESLLNKSKKEFDIPPKVQDPVSTFYYFRTLEVRPDSKVVNSLNSEEKNWKADMNIRDTEEMELTHQGSYKVFCVEPRVPFRSALARSGRALVYFTTDEKRVPVFIKIYVKFGYVTGVLERMQ